MSTKRNFRNLAIAEVAMRFNFLSGDIVEVVLRIHLFKIFCGLIARRFQFFFFLANSAILYFKLNFISFRSKNCQMPVFFSKSFVFFTV